jgi:hypothetical protein
VQYVLLIYSEPSAWESLSDEEREAMYKEYFALSRELREQNAYVDGSELESVSTATAVRVRDGEMLVTDGPFAETKEALGGYYVIDADTLDEAIQWASKIPAARHGVVEVRPIVMHEAEVSA